MEVFSCALVRSSKGRTSIFALAGWFSWLEHHPLYQKVLGLIPSQGICLDCRFNPLSGQHIPWLKVRAPSRAHTGRSPCLSQNMRFLSLPLSLKAVNILGWQINKQVKRKKFMFVTNLPEGKKQRSI